MVAERDPSTPEEAAALDDSVSRVGVLRVEGARSSAARDGVAVEEPLEIRIGKHPIAVVMRTPGDDLDLVRGFLIGEQVVAKARDIVRIRHCTTVPSPEALDNVVEVTLASDVAFDLDRLRRNLFASSSCGVCGKASIENVLALSAPIESSRVFPRAFFFGLEAELRGAQRVFAETGGLHAAGLFDADRCRLVVREDVGRHNAVDKVVGWALARDRLPLDDCVLMVSGRVSFEVVQKALAARIPVVVAVSAPTSLSVSVAQAAGIALVAFARGETFNVYGATERVATEA